MYSVRVSLLPPDTRCISQDEIQRTVGSLTFTLSWDGTYHILQVDGFLSDHDGIAFLGTLHSSIAWLLLDCDVPVAADLTPQRVEYCEDPALAAQNVSQSLGLKIKSLDGILDGSKAAVFETSKKLCTMVARGGSAHVTVSAEKALDTILEGSHFTGHAKLASDRKLLVALKLYGAYFTEASATARFLTLIMALEALATPVQRPPRTLEMINRWAAEVDAQLSQLDSDSEDAADFEALRQEILFRRGSSIRSQIRRLISSTLQNDNDVNIQARLAVRLYDLRSRLVHDGTIDPQVLAISTSDAKTLVLRVLRRRFRHLVQI
jgi:hypothetical protein